MKITLAAKLRALHIAVHLCLIPAFMYGEWWMWIGAYLMWFLTGGIGISLGFHRYFSHRSFECPKWFENTMLFLGSMTGGGSILSWTGIHRLHHKHSDTAEDPHGPIALSPFESYTHQWQRPHIPRTIMRDLLKKKNVVFFHRHYWKIMGAWAGLLFLIHPLAFIFLFAVPAVAAYHTYAQINTFCHLFGYRNFEMKGDRSHNISWLNFWAFGEGYHNNHHRFPSSYRIGLMPNEFDPCAWLLEQGIMTKGRKPSDERIAAALAER